MSVMKFIMCNKSTHEDNVAIFQPGQLLCLHRGGLTFALKSRLSMNVVHAWPLLKGPQPLCIISQPFMSSLLYYIVRQLTQTKSELACGLQLKLFLFLVSFTPTLQSGSSPSLKIVFAEPKCACGQFIIAL